MKTWFITGASRGFGLEIARAALWAGHRVVATARKTEQLEAALSGFGDRLLAVALDVTDDDSIQIGVDAAVEKFGRIDVLVNNAGYGQLGPFEQLSADMIQRQFATNVFGTFAVTRAVLPVMRKQHAGHIMTVSSIGGRLGVPGASIYCSSKFALEGWAEALSDEVQTFGISTTLIEPGSFRTDFLDPTSMSFGDVDVADYAKFDQSLKTRFEGANHQQPGDPAKLAIAVLSLAEVAVPPLRIVFGTDAYDTLLERIGRDRANAVAWRVLSTSTDLDKETDK